MKNITDEEIEKLLVAGQWRKVIENLLDVVQSNQATFHDYAAFIDAVSQGGFEDLYEMAFNAFISANSFKDVNHILLRGIYLHIEPIIKSLGFAYFDDRNSHHIPLEFYLRARFILFISSSKYFDAINVINKMIEMQPLAASYFQRSKIYGIQRKFKLAIQDMDKALELAPTDSFLYYNRGLLKQKIRDYRGAQYDFDTAINYNSKNSDYYFSRGLLHENTEQYKNAIDDFKKTVQLNPKFIKGFQEIAWCKFKMRKPEDALPFINIAMQLDDTDASNYYIRGCILNAMLKFEDALIDLSNAIALDNRSDTMWTSKIYNQKAWAELKTNKIKEAQADINTAIKLNSKDISYLFLAMDIEFFGTKDYYLALGHAKAILRIDPQNQRAISAITEIENKIGF